MTALVEALSRHAEHAFSKGPCAELRLVAGHGVEGDAHFGRLVQHLSRMKQNPQQANLRQVHLIHVELLEELAGKGFAVGPGQLGENVLTRGIDLLGLARGTRLRLGEQALIEITGLRNPCRQIDGFAPGLMAATLDHGPDGALIRKCGVMAVVIEDGTVRAGDSIALDSVPLGFEPLEPV
ncbi:MOSC domain-containing protein [Novosphingobium sp. B 225]|uniref:MOSC domain-containing protein n=1 Tax=Novosphingobium sp. B 225 TaxID=1961849 RepID=UPI000B4AA897|nr:MOSC domain-containing protein [Novosphingobium sp. B 225]